MDQFYGITWSMPEMLVCVSLFLTITAFCELVLTKYDDYKSKYNNIDINPYELKTKMTKYEDKTSKSNTIPISNSFVVRIDGLRSRGLLRKLKEIAKESNDSPHSTQMVDAMVDTAYDLQQYFRPSAIYFNSNEFLLFFPSNIFRTPARRAKNVQHPYSGQITKLLSLTSSVATYNFNMHLQKLFAGTPYENDINKFAGYHFQSKIVSFDNDELLNIANYLVWRAVGICSMSCRTMYAAYYLGKYQISNLTEQQRKIKLAEKGVSYDNVDDLIRYGLFLRQNELFTITDLKPSRFLVEFLLSENSLPLDVLDQFYTVFSHEIYTTSDNDDNDNDNVVADVSVFTEIEAND